MTTSSRRPLSSGEKRTFSSLAVLLLFIVAGGALVARINAPAVINLPPIAPLPNPNGFDVYVAAANTIRPANPAVDGIDDVHASELSPQEAAKKYSLANKEAWLRTNAAGFALFRQARTLPCVYPLVNLPQGNLNDGKMRQLARDKIIEANAFKLRGDWNGAVISALDIVQMGCDTGNGAPLIGRMVSDSIVTLGIGPLSTADDPISHLTLAQARAATGRLQAVMQRRSSPVAVIENQRWRTLKAFPYEVQSLLHSYGANSDLSFAQKWQTYVTSQTQIVDNINRNCDELSADAKKPFSAPVQFTAPDDPLSAIFFSSTSWRPQEARTIVPLNVLLLRLALRTYQLENGAYPAKLAQLVLASLAKVPTDYYADGKPLHYVNQGQTYLLYSVGPDQKDDGGTPIPWHDGAKGAKKGFLPPLERNSRGDYVAGANR